LNTLGIKLGHYKWFDFEIKEKNNLGWADLEAMS
jgi:hypothetical protein